jgi:hypothetical protein
MDALHVVTRILMDLLPEHLLRERAVADAASAR